MKKFGVFYIFAFICGTVAGFNFKKAGYYKGQADAYEDCANQIKGVINKYKQNEEVDQEEL